MTTTMTPLTPTSDGDQAANDDDLIRAFIENPDGHGISADADGADLGPKADDAQDFEDIGDDEDDLAVDEDEMAATNTFITMQGQDNDDIDLTTFGLDTEDNQANGADEFDDLFGDGNLSPELEKKQAGTNGMSYEFEEEEELGQPIGPVQDEHSPSFGLEDGEAMEIIPDEDNDVEDLAFANEEERAAFLYQKRLFAQASGAAIQSKDFFDEAPLNQEEALAQMWPRFKKDEAPRFLELMPFKKARWLGKKSVKPPKPVQPTKLKLGIVPDQEKHFKLSIESHKRKFNQIEDDGLVRILPLKNGDGDSDSEDGGSDLENDLVGGVSWRELQTICADWDVLDPSDTSDFELLGEQMPDFGEADRPAKRQRLRDVSSDIQKILNAPMIPNQSFDNYERLLAKAAKRVVLDINDPNLLLVPQDFDLVPKKSTVRSGFKDGHTVSTKDILKRYNISNDEAYDKLKQNHQSKIRSTLGNLTLNHSMPALRLTYPFYKTSLTRDERRRLHRPVTTFKKREPISFDDVKPIKRKTMKGRDAKEVFATSEDLGLGDTSYSLLLEYSEEAPTILTNFGMNSRLISYYRRKTEDDETRPKVNLGELNTLMPNDTSPLTQFGEIKPGEVRPTLYNAMYKAPVFTHDPKPLDFLMIRSSSDKDTKWYLRPIENLMIVGQQFPSTEVPPPGGRKVTTVSKNRLKMISYRLMKKGGGTGVNISKVTEHVAESSDMQNRQKMKDFLAFNKETKEWEMQGGAAVPEEEVIRTYITPEDVCLLESMQVGEQRLDDEGYGLKQGEAMNEDEEAKADQSIEEQLAPWQTTKNFLSAASNKAMLQLYGEGDPTGRGEAFSFLKVSMKGGFRAPNQSIEDHLDAKKRQESSGHNYNVQRQQEQYRETIADVWAAQNRSLSIKVEHDLPEQDPDEEPELDRRSASRDPRASIASFARRTDDDATSAWSSASQSSKVCRIVRKVRNAEGQMVEEVEVVTDPLVWKRYVDIKNKQRRSQIDIQNIRPEDDKELARQVLEAELKRLENNKERRLARDKQKAAASGGGGGGGGGNGSVNGAGGDAGSPGGASNVGVGKGGSTTRKCANCGQIGHIKTNKKLCPLLNGTMKPEDGGFGDSFGPSTPGV